MIFEKKYSGKIIQLSRKQVERDLEKQGVNNIGFIIQYMLKHANEWVKHHDIKYRLIK